MNEQDRKDLNDINRELMESNEDYNDLIKKLARLGRRIWCLKKRIEELLNGG